MRGIGRPRPRGESLSRRIEEYWGWIAAALFLLVTVDLLTTVYAAEVVGLDAESNPLVRRLLERSIPALAAVNIVAATVAAGLFYGVMATLRRTPERYRWGYALLIEVWLGLLLAAGLAVFANNLAVVVLGESLL